jgi:hypothetical protein
MFAEMPLDNLTVNKFCGRRRQAVAFSAFLGFLSGRLQRNHLSETT